MIKKAFLYAVVLSGAASAQSNLIEPQAGAWKTWVISSGKDFRVPPPPDAAATQAELGWLHSVATQNDARIANQVNYWDAGSPAFRWIDILINRNLEARPLSAYPHRVFTYVSLAMYDATIAAWESKYAYNRPRPSELDSTLKPSVAVPRSPSYPSEHAAVAAAAAEVLAYLLPDEAADFRGLAEEAGRSRLYAGVQFPSDYSAGLDLGRQVAARVIERAKADGSDAVWTGAVPTGPCRWIGTNPGNVTGPTWRPFLLSAANEFRPAPPPDCTSPEVIAQATDVRTFPRTFTTNWKAMLWQSPDGINSWPYVYANRRLFETKLDLNPPRAARAYALIAASFFDAFIASQDGKFTYWYIRPHQLDTGIVPLFPVPNFPSYPSNHSTFSATRSEVLAYLFPREADSIRALGKEAGDSRIWAGIHYQMDNEAGVKLGKSIAAKFIAWANDDGSH